jgi:hypothetical protein
VRSKLHGSEPLDSRTKINYLSRAKVDYFPMDKLNHYREIIQKILGDYSHRRSDENIESQAIFDLKRDHYQVVNVGWENGKRVYGSVIHLDIKNNKIWLQYNGTEIDIATKLVELGVPNGDIVLGFQAPHRRQYTDYATG